MRRLVSSPDAVGNLTFQDTEVPTPKANKCLIRVKAFSMNWGELKRPTGMALKQIHNR
jgi:NADPH:quinone reductase